MVEQQHRAHYEWTNKIYICIESYETAFKSNSKCWKRNMEMLACCYLFVCIYRCDLTWQSDSLVLLRQVTNLFFPLLSVPLSSYSFSRLFCTNVTDKGNLCASVKLNNHNRYRHRHLLTINLMRSSNRYDGEWLTKWQWNEMMKWKVNVFEMVF